MNENSQISGVNRKRTFDILDGMRGVAALAVIFCHISVISGPNPFPSAYLAVDLFFCLSGFVICYAYEGKLHEGLSAAEFLALRFARLWPLYVFGGVITFSEFAISIAKLHGRNADILTALANLVFIPLPMRGVTNETPFYLLNFPTWSLGFELIANGLFVFIARYSSKKRFVGLTGIGFIMLVATSFLNGGLDVGVHLAEFVQALSRVTFSFFAGAMLCQFKIWQRHRFAAHGAIVIFVALLFIFTFRATGVYRSIFDIICAAIVFPLLIYFGSNIHINSTYIRRPIELIGRASYAVYVLQVPLLPIPVKLMHVLRASPSLIYGTIFSVILFFISLIIDKSYDVPVRAWLSRKIVGLFATCVGES